MALTTLQLLLLVLLAPTASLHGISSSPVPSTSVRRKIKPLTSIKHHGRD
jgi:hypothetical protein